jgi:DNA invertase Pin-like site-specific DNA recombinase
MPPGAGCPICGRTFAEHLEPCPNGRGWFDAWGKAVGRIGLLTSAAYVRVSSRSQDDATQRRAIEGAARARGDLVDDWRAEKASARTMKRPELQRLLADARAGVFRHRRIYVFRLDRLTRTGVADTLRTLEELHEHCDEVVSAADGFELRGPHAEVIVAVMAWAAKMERLATNERIAAARDRVEAQGGTWGHPPRMKPTDVARAAALAAEGRSVRSIAMALGFPRMTVQRALASQKHASRGTPATPRNGDPEGGASQ